MTISVGGKVTFKINGFHTVDLPGRSGEDLPLLTPSGLASGVNDAAGNPFWFNGKVPNVGINVALFKPSGTMTYNGSQRIDTGLPIGKLKPLTVKFSKPGTYKYFCDVHPGMIGYVVVKKQGKSIPTAKQNAAALKKQIKGDVKTLTRLANTKPAADTVQLGASGPGGTELYDMFPLTLQVNAGTVVTFDMSRDTRETHTATFGPASVLKTLANGFGSPLFPAQGVYPSDPVQPLTESPTAHGDGFANTGVLDRDSDTRTILPSSRIDFTTPGTYQFICLVHPFMHGTVVVN